MKRVVCFDDMSGRPESPHGVATNPRLDKAWHRFAGAMFLSKLSARETARREGQWIADKFRPFVIFAPSHETPVTMDALVRQLGGALRAATGRPAQTHLPRQRHHQCFARRDSARADSDRERNLADHRGRRHRWPDSLADGARTVLGRRHAAICRTARFAGRAGPVLPRHAGAVTGRICRRNCCPAPV